MSNNKIYYAGLIAGLVFLSGDIVGGIITPDYSYVSNAVSELLESGANNRFLFSSFYFLHAAFIIFFAFGILINYPKSQFKQIYFGGLMLMIVGMCHALSSTMFPMDPVGTEATTAGILHLVLVGISVIAIFILFPLIGYGFNKLYQWKGFKQYTYISLAVLLISGIASPIIINLELPFMGLSERITGYVFYIWLFVLSYKLVRQNKIL